jgi:hypothetical protein
MDGPIWKFAQPLDGSDYRLRPRIWSQDARRAARAKSRGDRHGVGVSITPTSVWQASTCVLPDARSWQAERVSQADGRVSCGTFEPSFTLLRKSPYEERIHGELKWRWFLQTMPAPPSSSGMAHTLEENAAGSMRRSAQAGGAYGPRRGLERQDPPALGTRAAKKELPVQLQMNGLGQMS